jgi:ABC-type lipoprotein export system ATPase subunit
LTINAAIIMALILYTLTSLRTFRRRHIGYVFQNFNLIPFLTARENVQIALELNRRSSRDARRRAMELLAYLAGKVSIWDFGYYVGTFGEYDMRSVRR